MAHTFDSPASLSAFAAHAWRVGLGAALPPFNATEQVPRDNFMMAIFDGAFWTEANCPGGVLAPDGGAHGTLCQVTGQYEMPFGGYNSITPCEWSTAGSALVRSTVTSACASTLCRH